MADLGSALTRVDCSAWRDRLQSRRSLFEDSPNCRKSRDKPCVRS